MAIVGAATIDYGEAEDCEAEDCGAMWGLVGVSDEQAAMTVVLASARAT